MSDSPKLTDGYFLFYRCRKCAKLITKLQLMDCFARKTSSACPCGGGSFSPTDVLPEEYATLGGKWQWFRFNVLRKDDYFTRLWKMWYAVKKGEVAPAPEDLPEPDYKFTEVPPLKEF